MSNTTEDSSCGPQAQDASSPHNPSPGPAMNTHYEPRRKEVQDGPFYIISNPTTKDSWVERMFLRPAIGEAKMSNTNDIFDTFIKAKEALDKLPAAEQKIEELQHSLDVCRNIGDTKDAQIEDYAKKIQALQIAVAEAKRVNDDLSFRELQSRDSLNAVLSVLKSAATSSAVVEADELLHPLPEVPTIGFEPPTGTVGAGDSQSAPSTQDSGQGLESSSTSVTEGQSEPFPPVSTIGSITETGDTNVSEGHSASPFVPSTAEVSPVATQDAGSSQTQTPSTDIGNAAPQSADVSQHNEGRPYWAKPGTMTWGEWIDSGGNQPPYHYERHWS